MRSVIYAVLIVVTFIALGVCSMPVPVDHCKGGPEVYCSSKFRTHCNKTMECGAYASLSSCDKGPEVYCKTKQSAYECNKEAYCLTWPDDSVTAVKIADLRAIDAKDREKILTEVRQIWDIRTRNYFKYKVPSTEST